mmetsp:Transcript_2091/g.4502  ORF Transcript_2091/g.4502 Transcript_2091/m.4502 type:complete len:106 (-) Transcript_2091:329-646(-)
MAHLREEEEGDTMTAIVGIIEEKDLMEKEAVDQLVETTIGVVVIEAEGLAEMIFVVEKGLGTEIGEIMRLDPTVAAGDGDKTRGNGKYLFAIQSLRLVISFLCCI